MSKQLQTSAEFIQSKLTSTPKIGLILGSGLGILAEKLRIQLLFHIQRFLNFLYQQ